MILHLGVIDVPYDDENLRFSPKAMGMVNATRTTGEVAEILEDEYHVMEVFFHLHDEDIAKDLEGSLAGALENLLSGAPVPPSAMAPAQEAIQRRFKKFLEQKEMDALGYPGVPTKAALAGVNHRFKQPYKKRPERPSFIDTGLYESNFRAWFD